MDHLRRLEEIFAHFPGIGPRQARRFVYYVLNKPSSFVKEFAMLVEEVKRATAECGSCHRIFAHNESSAGGHVRATGDRKILCSICSDEHRDDSTLMVVARDSDFESVEKSGAYKGLYFILGGTVPILDKEPEKRIRLKSLLERVSASPAGKGSPLKEIILSLNTTPDGEHTTDIVHEAISKLTINLSTSTNIKMTILGRGLSTGAELEYADSETIKNALSNRK